MLELLVKHKPLRIPLLSTLEKIKNFIQKEKYEFYTHAVIKGKKDRVKPYWESFLRKFWTSRNDSKWRTGMFYL